MNPAVFVGAPVPGCLTPGGGGTWCAGPGWLIPAPLLVPRRAHLAREAPLDALQTGVDLVQLLRLLLLVDLDAGDGVDPLALGLDQLLPEPEPVAQGDEGEQEDEAVRPGEADPRLRGRLPPPLGARRLVHARSPGPPARLSEHRGPRRRVRREGWPISERPRWGGHHGPAMGRRT